MNVKSGDLNLNLHDVKPHAKDDMSSRVGPDHTGAFNLKAGQTRPLVDVGPMQPMNLALLSTLFLLREVEVGTAKVAAWSLDHNDQEISWNLPGSKTDPMALGTTRTWGCLCELPDFVPLSSR